jgi:site-specific recombinase XerD
MSNLAILRLRKTKTPPVKQAYAPTRRLHLTKDEVGKLSRAAATSGRYGERDALMITMAYRHALRASELVGLRWDQIDFNTREIRVIRCKGSLDSTQPLHEKQEMPALRRLKKQSNSEYVFSSERGGALTTRQLHRIVERAGVGAKLEFHVHTHMLRHATGYEMVNNDQGVRTMQSYMGHANINNLRRYTELSGKQFKKVNDIL